MPTATFMFTPTVGRLIDVICPDWITIMLRGGVLKYGGALVKAKLSFVYMKSPKLASEATSPVIAEALAMRYIVYRPISRLSGVEIWII